MNSAFKAQAETYSQQPKLLITFHNEKKKNTSSCFKKDFPCYSGREQNKTHVEKKPLSRKKTFKRNILNVRVELDVPYRDPR